MYLYNIGYSTCEESEYWQYFHANKYTNDELEEIIIQCMCEMIEHCTGRFDEHGMHDEPRIYVSKKGAKFQDLMTEPIFADFMKKKGFIPVEFEAKFSCFGWASAMKPGDWHQDEINESRDVEYQKTIKEFCDKKGIIIEQYTDEDGDDENYHFNWNRLNYKNVPVAE